MSSGTLEVSYHGAAPEHAGDTGCQMTATIDKFSMSAHKPVKDSAGLSASEQEWLLQLTANCPQLQAHKKSLPQVFMNPLEALSYSQVWRTS